jgi:hypothetical protein
VHADHELMARQPGRRLYEQGADAVRIGPWLRPEASQYVRRW